MQFLYQPLTWGFLLVGVPILVHLINMLRHRKQKWAAMDFLLESYKKNRRWVMLKQWLLLASRILVMLLLVLMLAKWISGAQWLSWLGGRTTHHYVLLDDSFSMGETQQGKTAYDRALSALNGLVSSLARRQGQHQITLVRWSRADIALSAGGDLARIDAAADLLGQSVPNDPSKLLERLNASLPSSLSLGPNPGIELISPLVSESAEQKSEVYLVTDLRRNEFAEPDELRNALETLSQNDAEIHFIDCGLPPGSVAAGDNLSIVSVEPEQEVWAAGVPLMVRFQIRNRSETVAKNVIVRVRSVSYPVGVTKPRVEKNYSGEVRDLPAIVVDQISAGETITRQVQVIFGLPGNHVVEVALDTDALAIDNRRWCTIDIQQKQRILLVDGEVEQVNAFFFENVVNPNPKLTTGMEVEKVDTSFLRDAAPELLNEFDVVCLLDVPRMDPQAVRKIEDYCNAGGGVFVVCGRNTNLKFVNEELFRDGKGLFPAKLTGVSQINSDGDSEPDVVAQTHPILAPLLQLESSPFFLLDIRKILTIDGLQSSNTEIVATGPRGQGVETGRNAALSRADTGPRDQPLILDSPYGDGRVVTMLTGLSSDWSNWAQDPTFVVLTLRTFGYLGSFKRPPTSNSTGSTIEMVLTGEQVLPEAELIVPGQDQGMRVRLLQAVDQSDDSVARLQIDASLEGDGREFLDSLLRPGVFEAWMVNAQGEHLVRNFAHNVSAVEGDLERVSHSELEQNLSGIDLDIRTADAMSDSGFSTPDAVHSTLLMLLLAALMLGEQALAYSASFHAPHSTKKAAERSGLSPLAGTGAHR